MWRVKDTAYKNTLEKKKEAQCEYENNTNENDELRKWNKSNKR